MTTTFEVEVTRDGKWWMIHVPKIDGLTQARRLSEVEEMARSLISISTDTRLDNVAVDITSIVVSPEITDLLQLTEEIRATRNVIRGLEKRLLRESREFAYYLEVAGIPVRDIAELLGVSPQRVSQLLHEQGEPNAATGTDVTDDVSDLLAKLEASLQRRRLDADFPVRKSAKSRIHQSEAKKSARTRAGVAVRK